MSQNELTIQCRDSKFNNDGTEGSIQTASDESESGETDAYGVIAQAVAEQLGEYFSITLTDDEDAVQAELNGDTKNFGKYATAGRQVYGMGVRRSILEDVFGEELPESIGLRIAPSTEEAYQDVLDDLSDTAEDEVDALLVGTDGDESDGDEEELSDEEQEAENLVDIDDEELGLVAE